MSKRVSVPRLRWWLSGSALLGLALLPFVLPGSVLGDDLPRQLTAGSVEEASLPNGLVPATRHEAVVVPAGPEDPDAPAETYTDPEPAPAGDDSSSRPVPDYLKGNPYRLSFVTGDYTPPEHERIDPRLIEGLGRTSRGYTYGYVMFEGAIQARKVEALEDSGVVFGNYHTFNSLQAWIPDKAIAALRVSPFVRWVGYARPEQKVDEFILEKLMQPGSDPTEELAVFVNVFESDLGARSKPVPIDAKAPPVSNDPRFVAMRAEVMMSNGPLQTALEEAGSRVVGYEDSIRTFYVWAKRSTIRRLMELDFVAGMDTAFPLTLDHDRSMRMTEAAYLGNSPYYNGKDASVAICDTGMHHAHRDLSQTYALGWDFSGEAKPAVDNHGHGTHVAGTVFGDGSARADRRFRGCAPRTGTLKQHAVFSMKLFRASGAGGPGWPNYAPTVWTLTTRSHPISGATALKSTVVQNSWGNGPRLASGYYGTDTLSRAADTNTHTHRQLYVMSSGNDGGNKTTQYLKSTRPPGVAKSAFTVGSIMDYDDTTRDLAGRYPGAHRFSSSKGPTRDGRVKPQVSAPGCYIVSARTNTTSLYTSKSGTSMSAPHVSGIAASMHDQRTHERDYPCLSRANFMAGAAPYANTRTWSTSSESYYNRRGVGQVDAYHFFSLPWANGWSNGYTWTNLTRSSKGIYMDVNVPADAKQTFFVVSWDEKAPALNATKAVLYNFDLVLDVEPFDPDITKGEYSSRYDGDNYEWYSNIGSISAVRGKKVRVKVPFVRKPTSTTEVVRVAMAYHIPRGDATPPTSATLAATPSRVKPGTTISVTGTAVVPEYRANNLYMYLSKSTGFTVTTLEHITRDDRTLRTDTVVSATDSKTNWTLGNVTFDWKANHRKLVWTMKAPTTNGLHPLQVALRGDNSGVKYGNTSVCVDGQAPNKPGSVKSITHNPNVWTNARRFTATWKAASDVGCAGMAGYGTGLASTCPKITARNLGNLTTYSTTLPASASGRWTFGIRSFDRVGNSSTIACIGPFLIDTVAPTGGRIAVLSGASTTRSLTVSLNSLGATETGSGLYRMRFSNNGATWSPWEVYAATRTGWSLAAYGGNSNPGTKRVYVQYRDRAGNASGSYSDTIVYQPLAITSISPSRGTLIGRDLVTITGVGFLPTAIVEFGSTRAPTVSVVSPTRITCRTPTHLVGERVNVRVRVGASTATRTNGYEYVGANILATGNPRLATPFTITFNAPVDGGKAYVAAASLGRGPIPLSPHNPLPLSPDPIFLLTVQNLIPTMFGNFQGVLNGSGRANGRITLPGIPALTGLTFYTAFVTLDGIKPLGIRTVSQGKSFKILP